MSTSSRAAGDLSFIVQARQTAQALQGQGNLVELEKMREGYYERYQQGDQTAGDALKATFDPPATSTPQINRQGSDIAGQLKSGTGASVDTRIDMMNKGIPVQRGYIDNKLYGLDREANIRAQYNKTATDTAVGAQERIQNNAFDRGLALLDRTSIENQRGRELAFELGSQGLSNELQIANKYADTAAGLSKPTALDYLGLVPQLLGSIALTFA